MKPSLSLAVVCKGPVNGHAFWSRFLLLSADASVEVHFVYDDIGALSGMPPGVQARRLVGASLFAMWGAAIAQSRGDYVAILHLTAPPALNWLDAVRTELTSRPALLCGPVEAQYPPGDNRWIGFLVEYAQFHRPIAPALREVPGNNLVILRELAKPPPGRPGDFSKTALLDTWTNAGLTTTWAVDAVVTHMRPYDHAAFRARRFAHARSYAAGRSVGMSHARRLLLMAATPIVAPLRVLRIARHCRPIPPLHAMFNRFFSAIILSEASWALGEFFGYATRRGADPATLD